MKKVIVYGMGGFYHKVKNNILNDAEIIAFANSVAGASTAVSGKKFEDKMVLSPAEINAYEFDVVYICTEAYNANSIYETLITNGISSDKIEFLWKRTAINGKWEDIPVPEEKCFISDINGIKIKQKYHTDFDFVPEVFYYNAYFLEMGEEDSIVIDIGMNIGIASLYFAAKKEVRAVYGFEPFVDTYNQAIDNFKLNKDDISCKIHTFNYGLSDKDEEVDIALNADESGYRNVFTPASSENSISIVLKNAGVVIEEIINENQGKKVILKCDTEGSEYNIVNSIVENGCIDKIDAVLMEYHGGADKLIKILKENSFKVLIHGPQNALGMLYAIK